MSRLEKENILHVKKIPEKAKWVVCNKSSDGKKKRILRKEVLKRFSEYCAGIFVDEAQDIGGEVKSVFEALDMAGVEIVLYGDPKQDIKGFGCFRELITNACEVKYILECYRCPQKHLDISNLFSPIYEKQIADKDNAEGSMGICFENDIADIGKFLNDNNWGLKYISRKQGRFTTHGQNENYCQIESLNYMVYKVVTKRDDEVESELYVKRNAFYIAEKMLEMRKKGVEAGKIITYCVNKGMIKRLNKTEYIKMMSALNYKNDKQTSVMIVKSIESVKGLEDKNCLFIVTKDIAPYLFQKKTDDNKEKHLLYVALTRSLDNLIILITKEVEELYGREEINRYFEKYNVYEDINLLNRFN
ncbi:UvrD-like helicase C-terminal domain-containing protein [Selenomonas ruminantium]|uniref:UvrD-like helicase C-terminal domain-containing protein n=2 Tax=Selenomonas ruminantium TaxID=971 RepID=A0A1I0WSV4_SELRU|nr:UvrD-like helicase C-terminal domain-containing protein [Selenomonas ruminantium]